MFNKKLLAAITSSDPELNRSAWDVLAALRGPDDSKWHLKNQFTLPIRAWVFGGNVGPMRGLVSIAEDIPTLSDLGRLADAVHGQMAGVSIYAPSTWHYIGHIQDAIRAIIYIEVKL